MDKLREYKLRYYFCRDFLDDPLFEDTVRVHEIVLRLLEEIRQRVGIDYELYSLSCSEEELIYKEHFVKRRSLLNKVHDLTVARALKSRSGNVYINNVVALVKDGEVVWYHEGWRRDWDLWRQKAEEIKRETGLRFVGMHVGFLKLVLENPRYLEEIIEHVEQVIRDGRGSVKAGHESLVFSVIERILQRSSNVAVLVEMPLGLRLLKTIETYKSTDVPSRFELSLRSLELAAYPLRADIVVIEEPRGLDPGVYPCARGGDQVFRLQRLYQARFPSVNVNVLPVTSLVDAEIRGRRARIVEVKTGRITEQAIGQVLTYEALLRIDTGIEDIDKAIAAPKQYIEGMNPLLRAIIDVLGIELIAV